MRLQAALLAALLLTASLAPLQAGANEPPLADAGLDQTVTRGTTVHLDASGSRDPDGTIASFEWSITTPSGETTTPDCPTCARTRFDPDQVGTYDATVTVTDDEGATAEDTLFVHVEPGDPPSITVSGPTDVQVGTALGYTATVEAGTASLSTITWQLDGETLRTEAVTGTGRRFDLRHAFQSTGSHGLTATIVDSDGLSASDSLTVQVDSSSSPGDGGEDATPGGGDTSGDGGPIAPSLAGQHSPVVRGDQLFTGEGPFTETYVLDVESDAVADVDWWRDGRRAGAGSETTLTWSPGRHSLYAVVEYTDGSVGTARFRDGTPDVEVDPEPRVELRHSDGFGSLTGVLRATDEYENLRSVSVSVDGTPVASESVDPLELRSGQSGGRLDLSFDYPDIDPGEMHRVVLRARDARGQVAETVEMIEAVGVPEVIRSEFVNDPVDSYHPRLDPERYTAKHVLKVRLNGVDPSDISVRFGSDDDRLHHIRTSSYVDGILTDIYTVESYWSGSSPGKYWIGISIASITEEDIGYITSEFEVASSPPEPVVEVISDGTPEDAKTDWGLVVDASRSFDPDGTELDFIWKYGARAISEDKTVAKFDSFDIAELVIEDGDEERTTVPGNWFLRHYTPPIRSVVELTEGPYKPNESVTFEVTTSEFKLPKLTYYDDAEAGIRIADADGRVDGWGCSVIGPIDENVMEQHEWDCEILRSPELVERKGNHFYKGTVTFEASEFADGASPGVYVYNKNTPERSTRRVHFPEITVLEEAERFVSDVEVLNTSYLVEEPVVVRRETPFESVRDQYLSQGFAVERTEMSGTEYTLEKRVKVREAEFETEEQTFDSRGARNVFLQQNSEWERGRTWSELRTWTTTEQEWRDTKAGPGEFTGSTRRVQTEPAEYRYERQYRHYYTVEKTGTREVTRQRRVRVPVTRYRTKQVCVAHGCYLVVESYTEWVTRTSTYTTTETYTYTVTESSTYWSTNKRNADDRFTGKSRKVEIKPAEYEQQYLYEYEKTHEERVWYYTARKKTLIQPAEYEWQAYKTTKSAIEAHLGALRLDVRIGDVVPTEVWFLAKQTGIDREWVDSPASPDEVRKTRAVVNETVTQSYTARSADDVVLEETESRVRIYAFSGYLVPRVIEKRIIYDSKNDTSDQ